MKHILYTILAAATLLASCSKPKPSTTPLHPSQPAIVATTDDEIRNLVTAMTGSDDWTRIMSADLLSLMDEAEHLAIGITDGSSYTAFDWNCKTHNNGSQQHSNDIVAINITQDSVTVDMKYTDQRHNIDYTLVMKHENGRWCIDDIQWPEQTPPLDTERHIAGAIADDAINNLTTGDVDFLIGTNMNALIPDEGNINDNPYETHPQAIEYAIKCIETAHNYLKQNRNYTTQHEQQILTTLQHLKQMK